MYVLQVYSQAQQTENVLELVHFEDLPLGGEWSTRRRTVTEAEVSAFVGLSGDYNPLYTDVEHARAAHFGERVYETVIPRTVRLSEAPSFGKSSLEHDPTGAGARAYRALAKEFIQRHR